MGRHIVLDGVSYDVVGILPPDLPVEDEFEILAPLQMDQPSNTGRLYRTVRTLGRLKEGVTIAQANADLKSIAADLGARFSNDRGYSFYAVSFLDQEVGAVRSSLWILAAAVGCVLLIACSNVASLLLARGAVATSRNGCSRRGRSHARSAGSSTLDRKHAARDHRRRSWVSSGDRSACVCCVALDPRAIPRSQSIHADLGVLGFAFAVVDSRLVSSSASSRRFVGRASV